MWFSSYRKRSKKFYSKYKTQARNCKRHIFKPISTRTPFKCIEHLGLDLLISSINCPKTISALSSWIWTYPMLLWQWVLHPETTPKHNAAPAVKCNFRMSHPACHHWQPTNKLSNPLPDGQAGYQPRKKILKSDTANSTRFVTECKAIIQIELLFLWNNKNTLTKQHEETERSCDPPEETKQAETGSISSIRSFYMRVIGFGFDLWQKRNIHTHTNTHIWGTYLHTEEDMHQKGQTNRTRQPSVMPAAA